jgi:Zn-dependent protease with chaperone function
MGLAKIVQTSNRIRGNKQRKSNNNNSFKALFISDPDRASVDSIELSKINNAQSDQRLVQEILSREPTFAERLAETFSTHPNIVKRLKALRELE